jgi:2-amino-4-hydroxy-6-hydroxymethyldihydropteridine diphosphokinase
MLTKCVYLSLGSNLGDRERHLRDALAAIEKERIQVIACSSFYETEPQNVPDQPWFLNLVAACETRLFPQQMLAVLLNVERKLGRTREGAVPRGPRVIDIDVLLFGTAIITTDRLQVPHPRMLERRFVLEPLVELAPDLRYPGTGELLAHRLAKLKGQIVKKLGSMAASPSPPTPN